MQEKLNELKWRSVKRIGHLPALPVLPTIPLMDRHKPMPKLTCKILIGLASLLSICAGKVYGYEPLPEKLYVNIQAKDSVFESGLLRRLREFKDVEISYDKKDAYDGIIVLEYALTRKGIKEPTGYVINVVFTINFLLKGDTDGTKTALVYSSDHLYTGSKSDLDSLLDEVIADINVGILEPHRKSGS